MSPLIALPAAGASVRMRGRDKLLETIEAEPLLRRQARTALASGCPVVVTLPVGNDARRKALKDLPVAIEEVPDAAEGMAASLRHITTLLAPQQSLGILLPDVPGIKTADILTVLDHFRKSGEERVTRAGETATDRPGTPLFLPHEVAQRLSETQGDEGGRAALKGVTVDLVRFPDDRAVRDLDTVEDWTAWRKDAGHCS